MMRGWRRAAIAIDQGCDCDNSEAAAEGEAIARRGTAVPPQALRVELLENKLHAGVYLLNLSLLRLHCF
jgi:hypothetical protein